MSDPMRVLFVGRSAAHFAYFESIITSLLRRGADVELLLDKDWSKNWGDASAIREFSERNPALVTGWSVRRSDKHRARIFALRELRSFRSYLTRRHTTPFYIERWRKYLTKDWQARVSRPSAVSILKTPLADMVLRLAERLTPPDRGIVKLLRDKSPDAIIVSPLNMRFSEETDYVKAAKKLKIPTALPVYSWDNLTTKGLVQISPDKVFVWNETQNGELREIHNLPSRNIVVAGSPFFDKWFSKSFDTPSRRAFCEAAGLDPSRKILIYLGSSGNIAKDETWFVEEVEDLLASSEDPELNNTQILIRPHPANAEIYRRLSAKGMRVWPEDGALPDTREALANMRGSFVHAHAALGINTSAMIDSVLADVPTFSVRLPRYATTQTETSHFKYLEASDALQLVDGLPALASALSGLAQGVDPKAGGRQDFARTFARPRGLERAAGDVIAEAVLELAQRRSA